jgi:hypothetical protein
MVKCFFLVYLLLNYVTRGRKRETSLWSVPYIHTGCYDGLVSRVIFAANSCEYHKRKFWSARRLQIWRLFSRFLCRYLYVQTRHSRIYRHICSYGFCTTSSAGEWTTQPFALCIRMNSYEDARLFSVSCVVWETLDLYHIFFTGSATRVGPWPPARLFSRRLYP